MAIAEDIARIIEQERGLEFPSFDEDRAFAVASRIGEQGRANRWPIVCDVRLWDRQVCYVALAGSSGDNPVWALRKSNTVRRLLKSSYRATLEANAADRMFPPHRNLPVEEFALSGGSFPIRVKGAGVIGSITVSGLHERDDHEVVVAAICEELGLDIKLFALSPRGV
jgi:uncharacterized protein (UPF0303 family)